ncbi:MAG: hypothetical protein RJB42_679, partial [Bacteroidota bacterium]
KIEIKMIKPKLANKVLVKTAVWVRKPGPIADVAIKNAAAIMGELDNQLVFLFVMLSN